MKKGWYGDNWRHSLAAKGIESKPNRYFQQAKIVPDATIDLRGREDNLESQLKSADKKESKDPLSPVTLLSRARAERKLQELSREEALAKQPGQQILSQVKAGDFSQITNLSQATDAERRAIVAEANRQAVSLTQGGQDVPESVEAVLTKTTKSQLKAIRKEQLVSGRTAFQAASAESFAGTVGAVEAGAKKGFEGFLESSADVRLKRAREQEKLDEAQRLEKGKGFPFADISDNVFLGDGVGGIGSTDDDGAFDFLSGPAQETSPMSSAIVPKEKFKGPDFGAGSPEQKSFSEKLADQVEDLWSSRHNLGRVDKSPLSKGERAFRMGDREKLVEAINEQEFQTKQQESRWRLVDQTRSLVETSQNRQDIFEAKPSSPFSFSMLSSKGNHIADQTKKINDVKKHIKQGADESRARSARLRGHLARMDSTIPPVTSLPEEDVRVFKKEFSFADLLKQRGAADE
jgi:hypothetical protein